MKMQRPLNAYNCSTRKSATRAQAEAEAVRLIANKNDMFERYLKKPSTTSVGFLVLSQLNSSSSRQNQQKRESRMAAPQYDRISTKTISRGRQARDSSSKQRDKI